MHKRSVIALGLALAASLPLTAAGLKFAVFTPLTSSAAGIPVGDPQEATSITLGNDFWSQRTIADRTRQNTLVPGANSGNYVPDGRRSPPLSERGSRLVVALSGYLRVKAISKTANTGTRSR